jgi:hypothetical protein
MTEAEAERAAARRNVDANQSAGLDEEEDA